MRTSYWPDLIEALGGFAVLVSALSWLTKSLLSHFLSKDVAAFKARISADASREIERLKSDLQLTANERALRFERLHDKRMELIAELYFRLETTTRHVELFITKLQLHMQGTLDQDRVRESIPDLSQKCKDLMEMFERSELYFSRALAHRVKGIIWAIYNPPITMSLYMQPQYAAELPAQQGRVLRAWETDSRRVLQTIHAVEEEFRTLLGA